MHSLHDSVPHLDHPCLDTTLICIQLNNSVSSITINVIFNMGVGPNCRCSYYMLYIIYIYMFGDKTGGGEAANISVTGVQGSQHRSLLA